MPRGSDVSDTDKKVSAEHEVVTMPIAPLNSLLSLDEKIQKIVSPFRIRRTEDGVILTCANCGSSTEFTYREVCGNCFLSGHSAIIN